MTVTPNGDLYLCKTKLENDYKNQFTWDNINTQNTYFNGTVQNTFSEYTYMKKDSSVTVNANIDDIIDCNYLFYVNNGFTTKRYYCFITNMVYVNENTTRITFETDCFQTWYFELQYNRCFVEREHVNNDTAGLHTIPEGLETGSPIMITNSQEIYSVKSYYICMAVTELIGSLKTNASFSRIYNKVYSGLYYIIFNSLSPNAVGKIIDYYDSEGKADAINSLFIVPDDITITQWYQISFTGDQTIYEYAFAGYNNGAYILGNYSFNKPTALKNYTPKNKKLLTYPYSYFYVTNNVGSDVEYRYEDFYNNTIQFNTYGAISPGFSMKTVPFNYKYDNDTAVIDDNGYNYGVVGSKLPVCSWDTDVYINWLTQNANNIALDLVGSTLNMGMGITNLALGNPMGLGQVTSGAMGIAGKMAEVSKMEITPPQARGSVNSSDVTFALGRSGVYLYRMCIKEEYAKIIDNYFSMFGYKVNDVKIPNITGRRNWNYVKTVDCNVDGDIPQTDLNIIKTMFNNGVTLWHNPANIYNYSLDNSII